MTQQSTDEHPMAGGEETIVRAREHTPVHLARNDRMLTQRACLEVTAGTLGGQRFYLEPRDHVIGRSNEADIPLPDDAISRLHARVAYRNDGYILTDLDSKNGTFLNGTKVHECPLHAGDEITIGGHSMQFLYETVLTSVA